MLNMRVAWTLLLFQLSCSALSPAPPLDVATVDVSRNIITLENKTTTLGLQSALNSQYPSNNGTITLFQQACNQNDGTLNCTAACQNNTQMFSSLETLHNCVVFPEISVRLANNSLTANARRLAEELNIQPSDNHSSLPSIVSNKIQSCLVDSCVIDPDCNKTLYGRNRNPSPSNLNGTSFLDDTLYFQICGPIPAYVIGDVGGIGIFISYVMQMGLTLIAFLVTVPWSSIAKRARTSLSCCFGILSGSSRAKQHSHTSPAPKKRQYSDAVISALVGFQKAQCWFMLATNIAGLIVERSGGLEPDSLQILYNTYVFIKVIAIGGFLPITFTLLNLHMIKKLSWYPLTLSIVTIAVAITTLKSGSISFTPTIDDFGFISDRATQSGPRSCALQTLSAFCYNPRKDGSSGFNASSSGSGADDILIICLVTLIIIIIDHLSRSDDPKQQMLNRRILHKLGVDPSKPLFPHAGAVLRYGTAAFHFIFFWLYVYCFYLFALDLNWFAENNVYDPAWGFGQIVAVVAWLPTLFDYAWDQIRGVPEGSKHRLPRMYEVVKRVQEEKRGEEMELPLKLPDHHSQDSGTP